MVVCAFHDGDKKRKKIHLLLSTGDVCALISSLFSLCPIFFNPFCFFLLRRFPIEFKWYNPQTAVQHKP